VNVASGFWPSVVTAQELCFTRRLEPSPSYLCHPCSLQKHKSIPSAWAEASWTSSECFGPNSWGSLSVPFTRQRRLAPNSSPSKVRFNPDEPNLLSLSEFSAESITPTSWGWNSTCDVVFVTKKPSGDAIMQLCVVIPLAGGRSIITHNRAATSLAGLLELWGSCHLCSCGYLWIANVILNFFAMWTSNRKVSPPPLTIWFVEAMPSVTVTPKFQILECD
jgi:hypothetical protein